MMYLSAEELVTNIADQSERAAAVIAHTDLNSDKFNANAVITSFLGNIFDSALIVIALEKCSTLGDCHRNALALVTNTNAVNKDVKQFISQITRIRQKYALDGASSPFDPQECLDFLNAYDCFMFDFLKNSSTVRKMTDEGKVEMQFTSMRNVVEKLLKKSAPTKAESAGNPGRTEELLEQILAELKKINQRLDRLEK